MVTTAGGGTRPVNWNNVILTGIVTIISALTIGGIYIYATPDGVLYINASTTMNGSLTVVDNITFQYLYGTGGEFSGDLIVAGGINASHFNGTYYGDGSQLIISTTYNASIITTESGTLDWGDLDSILVPEDGLTYNVSEDAGAAPLTIAINFTGIETFDIIIGRIYYEGGQGHEIQIEIQRSDTLVWESYLEETDMTDFVNIDVPIFDPENHVFASGDVAVRFNHDQNGNPSHNFFIDYLAIIDGFTALTVADHDALGGRDQLSNHPWALDLEGTRNMTGNLTVDGNVTAFYFYGDGGGLTGLETGDNASWNESYANTLYAAIGTLGGNLSWNETRSNLIHSPIGFATNSSYMTSITNSSYMTSITNDSYMTSITNDSYMTSTFNQSYANLLSWNNLTGIPTATPSDGDTTHFSLADEIWDWAVGLFLQAMDYTNVAMTNQSNTFTGINQFTNTDILIAQYLRHYGNNDTYIAFETDAIWVFIGGLRFVDITNTTTSKFVVNPDLNDIDFSVHGAGDSLILKVDASEDRLYLKQTTITENLTLSESMVISQDKYINYAGSLSYDNGTCYVVEGRTATLAVC